MSRTVEKSESEWKSQLAPEQYRVARLKGTERPFTGDYWNVWSPGEYRCVCCGARLFHSDHKFDAGCGWPSFFTAAEPDNIETQADFGHGMQRVEVLCQQCGAHLGHVFEDGPQPTGLRFCINSASLRHDPAKR